MGSLDSPGEPLTRLTVFQILLTVLVLFPCLGQLRPLPQVPEAPTLASELYTFSMPCPLLSVANLHLLLKHPRQQVLHSPRKAYF